MVGQVMDLPQPEEASVRRGREVAYFSHLFEEILPAASTAEEVCHVFDNGDGHCAFGTRLPGRVLHNIRVTSMSNKKIKEAFKTNEFEAFQIVVITFSAAEAKRVWKVVQREQG